MQKKIHTYHQGKGRGEGGDLFFQREKRRHGGKLILMPEGRG